MHTRTSNPQTGTALLIVNECTGIDATILLVSAVLVFPAAWRPKLIGIGLAVAVMMSVLVGA